MASNTNDRLQGGVRTEYGYFTPEPSVAPEPPKGIQATPESSDQSNPAAATAGTSARPSPDTNTNAEPAGQNNPVEGEPKGSEPGSSSTGSVGQAASSTSERSNSEHPTTRLEPTDGATTEHSQPPPGVSDVQAREVERIMAADPKLAFKVLDLAGLQSKEKAEEKYQELVALLRPDNCGHAQASEAIKRLDDAIKPYRSADPVTTGAEFVDADGEPMDTDSSDRQSNASIPSGEEGRSNTESSGSLFMPEENGPTQTSENADGASSGAEVEWKWATGLTCDGKRIMAYRTHGRGHRAVVETEKGSEVFHIRSGMECGGAEMKRYLAQEGILELKPSATRRQWSYKDRGDFVKLCYIAISDYKTHGVNTKSGSLRKDPEAWGFAEWTWGFEEIVVSDLRKVIGRESADAAIRAICKKHKRTPPMDQRPQQIVVETTPAMFAGSYLKQTPLDTNPGGDLPHMSGRSKQAAHNALPSEQTPKIRIEEVESRTDPALLSVLGKIMERLDMLEERTKTVDELTKDTTVLSQVVSKLVEKIGFRMDG